MSMVYSEIPYREERISKISIFDDDRRESYALKSGIAKTNPMVNQQPEEAFRANTDRVMPQRAIPEAPTDFRKNSKAQFADIDEFLASPKTFRDIGS